MRLKDKTALILGGSAGIGLGYAVPVQSAHTAEWLPPTGGILP